MAVALEFISFIVPIKVIRRKYLGGWERCLKDHQHLIGRRVWFDDHLLRDGAMNPQRIESLVHEWTHLGLHSTERLGTRRCWKDCCVVESLVADPTLHCDWLEIGDDGRSAHLKGAAPGRVIGRSV